jgi:hypothetical protein
MCGCETWSLTVREEKNENFLEQGAEENIWSYEGGSNSEIEKVTWWGASQFVLIRKC